MNQFFKIIKIVLLFLLLPIDICRGSKKKAYMRIKKLMISANLL